MEDEALTMKELFAAYYIARAGVIEKFIKESYIEDYGKLRNIWDRYI